MIFSLECYLRKFWLIQKAMARAKAKDNKYKGIRFYAKGRGQPRPFCFSLPSELFSICISSQNTGRIRAGSGAGELHPLH